MEARIAEYEAEKASGQPPGFELGIPAFDEMIGGVRPGNVVVLSGYLNTGKSLGCVTTLNIIEQAHSALFLTLEMSRHEVFGARRHDDHQSSHKLLRVRQLPEEDFADVAAHRQAVPGARA